MAYADVGSLALETSFRMQINAAMVVTALAKAVAGGATAQEVALAGRILKDPGSYLQQFSYAASVNVNGAHPADDAGVQAAVDAVYPSIAKANV